MNIQSINRPSMRPKNVIESPKGKLPMYRFIGFNCDIYFYKEGFNLICLRNNGFDPFINHEILGKYLKF